MTINGDKGTPITAYVARPQAAGPLPGVVLVPFPVVTDRQRAAPWWASGATARLMLTEYVKYIFARLRIGLNTSATHANAPGRDAERVAAGAGR